MRRSAGRKIIVPTFSPPAPRHGCGGKRCYATFCEADQAAKNTRRFAEAKTGAYACRNCHQFHVGELQPTKRARKRPHGPRLRFAEDAS